MFEKETINNAILYILQQLGGSCDMHKICKILYFADQRHLKLYGRTIIDDEYIAMKYGPVPSKTYDILKTQATNGTCNVSSTQQPNMAYLSESDVECLDYAIAECKNLSFHDLTEHSHQYAWQHTHIGDVISTADMLKEVNAPQEYIDYISEQMRLDKIVKTYFN